MRITKNIMGMPITVEIPNHSDIKTKNLIQKVFDYFVFIDKKFSTYKKDSEVSMFNNGQLDLKDISSEFKEILDLSEKTKKETNGFFDIKKDGNIDPSGIVKGWAIWNASKILDSAEVKNYYLDAGSDIQVKGKNEKGENWKIGVRNPFGVKNPFKKNEIVKVLNLSNCGVATSGNYERGLHIYNPKKNYNAADEIASITIVGPNVYEADRFATAAFAMGISGINFISTLSGFSGYMINKMGVATYADNNRQIFK